MRIVIAISVLIILLVVSGCVTESKTCTAEARSNFGILVNQGAQLYQDGYQIYSVNSKIVDTNWYALEDNYSLSNDTLLFVEFSGVEGSSFEVGLMLNGVAVQKETVRIIEDPQDDCKTIGDPEQVVFMVE
jgi:hypothetical protein